MNPACFIHYSLDLKHNFSIIENRKRNIYNCTILKVRKDRTENLSKNFSITLNFNPQEQNQWTSFIPADTLLGFPPEANRYLKKKVKNKI